jgi:hypothetical protein
MYNICIYILYIICVYVNYIYNIVRAQCLTILLLQHFALSGTINWIQLIVPESAKCCNLKMVKHCALTNICTYILYNIYIYIYYMYIIHTTYRYIHIQAVRYIYIYIEREREREIERPRKNRPGVLTRSKGTHPSNAVLPTVFSIVFSVSITK